jgi:hypothetical protein
MSETLEVRTSHAAVADVVQDLAKSVDDTTLRLPSSRSFGDGDWVRFTVRLNDNTPVIEGIGRCQSAKKSGAGYEVVLSLLQFDERNEIMYERVLIARDTDGPVTGMVDVRGVEEAAAKAAMAPKPAPAPPPKPAKPMGKTPSKAPPSKSIPPPAKSAPAPPPLPKPQKPASRPELEAAKPVEVAKPAKPAPKPKPEPSKPLPRVAPAPPKLPSVSASELPPPPPPEPPEPPTDVSVARPSDRPGKGGKRRIEVEIDPNTAIAQAPEQARVAVAAHLAARARTLAPNLPRSIFRGDKPSEEAVLQAALRIGLAALATLADVEDDL